VTYLPGQGSQQPHSHAAKPRHKATTMDTGTLARRALRLAAHAEPPLTTWHLWSRCLTELAGPAARPKDKSRGQ